MYEHNITELSDQYAIADKVSFTVSPAGFPEINVNNQFAEARISLLGAQVLHYKPTHTTEPVLFHTKGVSAQDKNTEIHGGIPICWPWFCENKKDNSQPFHGFARRLVWDVKSTYHSLKGETIIQLTLQSTPLTHLMWPHEFKLLLTITIGRALSLHLTTENAGELPFTLETALHTYFNISDLNTIYILGLENTSYLDKQENFKQFTQSGVIKSPLNVDRIFLNTNTTCRIIDEAYKRKIVVSKQGSQTTVMWNPGEGAAGMANFIGEEHRRMICLETANIGDDAQVLGPHRSHTLMLTINVEAI